MSHKFVVFQGWVYLDGLLGFSPKVFSKERSSSNPFTHRHLFWDVLSSFILSHYLLWCSQAAVWVAGMRPGQGDEPKVMTSLQPWRAAVALKYHNQPSYRFTQSCFPSICCLSSCFPVYFALPVLARSCTLSPVHKQIKVLAGDTAPNLLWVKTQMPLRMPNAASQARGAPQEWEQLSDWALQCSSCAAWDQLFEEDSYVCHHWPHFDHPSICSSFYFKIPWKSSFKMKHTQRKYSKRILLGRLAVWEICRITNIWQFL